MSEEVRVQISRRDVAEAILRSIRLEAIRREARSKREWAIVFHGFRPQLLTRAALLNALPQFAANLKLLHDLCTLFLDEIGAEPSLDIRVRFAATMENPALDSKLRDVCFALVGSEIRELPLYTSEIILPDEHTQSAHIEPDNTPSQNALPKIESIPAAINGEPLTQSKVIDSRPLYITEPAVLAGC